MDADKTSYPDYYEECLRAAAAGRPAPARQHASWAAASWTDEPDESATVMAELNDRIAADDRVEAAMLGVADGITVVLKK